MRILCLPIDSRPCNTQFIRELVAWAGHASVFPRPEEMDDFTRPAPYEASRAFLIRELPECGAAVISLDHWCYGSLLASREDQVSREEALRRVQELKTILADYPHIPVYMSSVILRSSISALSRGDLAAYHAVTEYSVARDRFDRFGLPEDAEKAENARKRIPDAVLQKVLKVRERNLTVNLAAVDMAAEGIVKSLSLLQEDCQVYGLSKKDQRAILGRMRERNTRRVFLRNGTDEAGALSAAEALWDTRQPLRADFIYLGREDFTAPYEDRPFRENLESACREIGVQPTEGSDPVIFVCCPENGAQQEAGNVPDSAALAAYARAIAEKALEGKRVYVLDIIGANGGSAGLMRRLSCADRLWGYSAWNTASNSMGTLLAQVISDALRGEKNEAFYQERLLDDYVYQTVLRRKLGEMLEKAGEDIYRLRDKARAERFLRELFLTELPSLWPLKTLPEFRASLPWSRIFECEVQVKNR